MAITINGNGTVTGVSVGGLPDGIVDTDMLAANAVTAAKSSGSAKGITQADQWRVNSGFDSQGAVVENNWERNDTDFALIGSGMTQSSGLFTFPATGIYSVRFMASGYKSGTDVRYVGVVIQTTVNNSTYITRAEQYNSISNDTAAYAAATTELIFDVTNTSTHKVRFLVEGELSVTWSASTNAHIVGATFIRLGDT